MADSGLVADKGGEVATQNHEEFGNVLFVDGHVKGFSGEDWYRNSESKVGNEMLSDCDLSVMISFTNNVYNLIDSISYIWLVESFF